jgi:predicted TPR repeat methyltransferase
VTTEAFALAVGYHQAGQLAAAEALFRSMLNDQPGHFGALHRLGLLTLQTGRPTEAVDFLNAAVRLRPDSAAAHHNLGLALRRQGLPGQALACYRRAVALQPDNAHFHGTLAVALEEAGHGAEAVTYYQEALRLEPHQPRLSNNLGVLHAGQGRLAEAESCFRQALYHQPDDASALFNLTNALAELGRLGEAAACCRRLLGVRPDDPNVRFLHAALTGEGRPATMPPALVTALFDRYAPAFEEHLTHGVNYQGPQLLRAAVAGDAEAQGLDVLDLGCGTGLCGLAFRDLARTLTGVDLSANMLARARARGIYDQLIHGELLDVLRAAAGAFDLILAADVFIYVGDLAPVFSAAAAALRAGGRFAFVVEADDGTDYVLRPTRRYAHPPEYLRGLARSCGFAERSNRRAFLRMQGNQRLEGDVYVLQRGGTPACGEAGANQSLHRTAGAFGDREAERSFRPPRPVS